MIGNAGLDTPPSAALGMSGWGECGWHKRLTRSSRLRGQKLRVSRDPSDRLFSRFTPVDHLFSRFSLRDRVAIGSRGPGLFGYACLDTPPLAAPGLNGSIGRSS